MHLTNSKISLLAFDLDGTLLNDSVEIGESTLRAINSVQEKGVKVAICSGRISLMQDVFISLLGIEGPNVACNGALIVNSVDNSVLYSHPLEGDVLDRLCAFFCQEELHVSLQTLTMLYYTKGNPKVFRLPYYDRVAAKHGLPGVPLQFLEQDYSNFDRSPAYKALIYVPEVDKRRRVIDYLETEPELAYTFSEEDLFEVMLKGVDKGRGLEQVAQYYGIPLEEVCAFGDFDNDIPMFERAGTSVAMGNANANLKARATFVTATNDNDGVAKAIEVLKDCF